jgi:hypothetical protein
MVSDTVGRSVNSVDLGDVWFALTMERSGLVLGWRCLGRFLSMLYSFVRSVGRMWSADDYFSSIGLLAFKERNDTDDEKLWCCGVVVLSPTRGSFRKGATPGNFFCLLLWRKEVKARVTSK